MKRFILFLSALVLLTACELHTSDNGDLDGYWQLTQMDTLANNRSGDMRSSRIFWAVQGKMLEMRCERVYYIINYHFSHENGQLRLFEPIISVREISDSTVTDPATLHFYGITRLEEVLDVQQLDADRMTLQSDLYRFHFRKY